jgi:uncharacterized protein YjaG (DUF416 family)
MFQTNVVEEIKTHILSSVISFPENHALPEITWKKYCRARQATDGNIIQHILDFWWKALYMNLQNH